MKYLRPLIFAILAHQPLFFNLLAMEQKSAQESEVEDGNSTSSSLEEKKPLRKSPPVTPVDKRGKGGDLNKKYPPRHGSGNSDSFERKNLISYQLTPDDAVPYEGNFFIGKLPPGSKDLLDSFTGFAEVLNVFPILVKVVGAAASGKTTLVQHFAQRIGCTRSQFLEIGSLDKPEEIKKILKTHGIMLKQLPSEEIKAKMDKAEVSETSETSAKSGTSKGKTKKKRRAMSKREDIEAIIKAFYEQKARFKHPYIINFTKGLGLTDIGLRKLRETVEKVQKGKAMPLCVFHEAKTVRNYAHDSIDKIIHIEPPTPEDIKAILIHTFSQKRPGLQYDEIKPETLAKFQYSKNKQPYSRPHVTRIAEGIIRSDD